MSAPVQDGIGSEEVVVETEDDVVEVALLGDIIVEIEDDVDGIVLLEKLDDELVEIVDVLNEELVETVAL